MTINEFGLLLLSVAGSIGGYRLGRSDERLDRQQEDNFKRLDKLVGVLHAYSTRPNTPPVMPRRRRNGSQAGASAAADEPTRTLLSAEQEKS